MTDAHITKKKHSPMRYNYRSDSAEPAFNVRRAVFTPYKQRASYATQTSTKRNGIKLAKIDDSDSDILIAERLQDLNNSFDKS